MRARRVLLPLAGSVALLSGLLLTTTPATAAEEDTAIVGGSAADGFVIVDPAEGTTESNGATFIPTGDLPEDTLVVIAEPDGSLPGGLTEATLKQTIKRQQSVSTAMSGISAAAAVQRAYAATSGAWSNAYTGASVVGTDWSATVRYNFWAAQETSQVNAGQGLGYYQGYNGSTFGVWSQWYGLGSADSSGGGASVPWGNVAAVAKFRAQCATTSLCGGYFNP